MRKTWLILISTALIALNAAGTSDAAPAGSGGVNASGQLDAPYLVVVSLDGFRWDYPELFELDTLGEIARRGMRAERLLPVFPTLTFPNHYSIATGLFPSRHGIVGNHFPAPDLGRWFSLGDREAVGDGRFYGGEPIWVTAETQGMVSAAFFFVGTEAVIGGLRPTHWRPFDKSVEPRQRVDQALSWLAQPPETRPHLVMMYFETVDDHSHWSGVVSDRASEAIRQVDELLGRLMAGIDRLPHRDRISLLVVSDHGQSGYRAGAEPWVLDEHVALDGLHVIGKGSYLNLYLDAPDADRIGHLQSTIQASWAHGRALRPEELPDAWQVSPGPRQPDLFLLPGPNEMVLKSRNQLASVTPGAHGWTPDFPDMHGVLFGYGPGLQAGARAGAVRAVDVYPLMARLLGLQPAPDIDGNLDGLQDVLEPHPAQPIP